MKRTVLCLLLGAGLSGGAMAGTNGVVVSARVYAHAESFEWKESLQGQHLLTEKGPLFGVGGDVDLALGKKWLLELGGDVFFGQVDYNGAVEQIDGSLTPLNTTTVYAGVDGAAKLALRVPLSPTVTLKPAAGIGVRAWSRSLDSSVTSQNIGPNGYDEYWLTTHGILGATVEIATGPASKIFVEADLRLPLATWQSIDLSNVGGPGSVDLQPKGKVTVHAEAGWQYKKFFAAGFFETMKFSQSGLDPKYQAYFQPDSDARIIGAKAGVAF